MRAFRHSLAVIAAATAACSQPAAPQKPPETKPPKPAETKAPAPASMGPAAEFAPTSAPVVIVGGGLAGLVTAHELKKKGIQAHLLEASDQYGGRVQTAYYEGGLHAEYGLQEVWGDNPLLAVAKELNVELDGDVEAPYSSMVIDGKLYPYVQDTTDAYFASIMAADEVKALKDWMAKAKTLRESAMKDGLKNADVAKIQKLSMKDWVESFKLPHKVNEWIRLTIECELAYPWSVFSATVGLIEFGVFLGEGEPNYKVKGGNSVLIDALVKDLGTHGTLSALVTRIERVDGKVRVHYLKSRHEKVIEAQRIVVAIPPWRLPQIDFAPPLSKEKWDGINTLMRGQYTVVHLVMSKEARKIWEINGQSPFPVLADGPIGVAYGVMSDTPADAKTEVFSFLIHGYAAQAFHMVPRETKIKELLDKMDEFWPGFSKHVISSYVYSYHPASIAVWPTGRSPIDEKHAKLREAEQGLWLAGDWLYSGHSDGAAKSAMMVADAIAKETAPN